MDRVTYASVRVNPNELFTAGNGDGDDVCHGSDQDPGLEQLSTATQGVLVRFPNPFVSLGTFPGEVLETKLEIRKKYGQL